MISEKIWFSAGGAGLLVRHCQIGVNEAGNVLVSERGERRVVDDRRETARAPQRGCRAGDPAWEGRVQARSRTWPALYAPPGHAVSRAVEQFAEQHVSGRFSSI